MANVGEKTGKKTQAGRDVYKTPEGEMVSEKSTTFEYRGKWINIPTIHDGKQYSQDQLINMLDKGLIKPTSTHNKLEEAVKAAKSRSKSLKFNEGGLADQMDSMLPAVDDDTRSTEEYLADTKPMDISSVPVFQRPMDASENDQLVGEDDAGNPMYRTMLGNTYTVRRNPDQRTTRTKVQEDVLPAVKNWLQNPVAPSQEQILNIGKGIAESVYDLVSIPGDLATGKRSASDITLGDVYDTTGMMAVGSAAFGVPEGALRTFGGSGMELDSGELSNFKKARELMKAEISNIDPSQYDQFYWANKKVWNATGWYINPSDKQWRFEIDDSKSKIDWNNANISDVTGSELKEHFETLPITKPDNDNGIFSSLGKKARTLKLSDFFTHDNLYKRYPFLKDLDTEFYNEKDNTLGSFTPGTNLIKINVGAVKSLDQNDPTFRSTLLHEIQHAIQYHEGFSHGANSRYIPDEVTKDLVQKSEAIKSEAKNNIRKNVVDLAIKHNFKGFYDYFPLPSDLDIDGKKTYYDLIDDDEARLLEEMGIEQDLQPELYKLITDTADEYRKHVNAQDLTSNMEFKFYLGAEGEIESRLVQATLEDSAYQGTYPIDRANKMLNERDPDRYDEFVNTPEFRGKVGEGDTRVRTPDIGEADVFITPEKSFVDFLPEVDPNKPGYNMEFTTKDEIKAKTEFIRQLFKGQPKLKKLFNIKPRQKFTLNYEDGPLEVEFGHYSFRYIDKKNLRGEGSIIIDSDYDKVQIPTAVVKYPDGNFKQMSIMELINRSSLVKDFDIQDLRKTQKSPPGFLTNLRNRFGLKSMASAEGANPTLEDFGYYVDNPAKWGNTDWAKNKQASAEKYAKEGGKSAQKLLSGPQTAFLGIDNKKPLYLDTEFLSTLKGANDEVTDMSNPKYVDLKKSVEEEGFIPDQKGNKIMVGINHKGEAFIMEGNNRVAIAKEFGAPSVKAEVRYYNGAEEVDGPYSPQNILKYASQAPRQFAEGGTVDMNQQMSFAFEDGGLRDDGMMRDPVSGNEVPPGSTAKEVRDDIPAQLSEGEYVVPADVVRYYGVKFFEDLRDAAKMGLQDMEARGRIGGEPVPAGGPMNEDDLTPEELAAIQEMMGMSEGGTVAGFAPGGLQTDQDILAAGQQAQQNQFTGFPLGATIFPRAESGEIEAVPTTPTITTEETAESCAAKDMDYDPATKTCVPRAVATTTPAPSDDDGPRVEPPKWYEKYDYNDPEAVVAKSLATLGASRETEEKETQNALEKMMGSLGTGISSFFENNLLLGGIIRQQKVAEVAANAQLLRAQGREDLAKQLDYQVELYKDKHDIKDGGFFDSTKTLSKQLASLYSDLGWDEETSTIVKIGGTPDAAMQAKRDQFKAQVEASKQREAAKRQAALEEQRKKDAQKLAQIQSQQDDNDNAPVVNIQTDRDPLGHTTTTTTYKIGGKEVDFTADEDGLNKGGLMAGKPKTKTKRQYKKGGLAGKK